MSTAAAPTPRNHPDRCPGALRPWPAADGLLVRLRLVGGALPVAALTRLLDISARFGDGSIGLTKRANLQLRGLPGTDGRLSPAALTALESTGLLPSAGHELVRNIMVSPLTGHHGGRIDLRPVAADLDTRICAAPALAGLPGRFLFTLDDGRGDLLDRLTAPGRVGTDLGLVGLDADTVQLRVGAHWGPVLPVPAAAATLVELALAFVDARGGGPGAPWHIHELDAPLLAAQPADPRLPHRSAPPDHGPIPGGRHHHIPDGALTPARAREVLADTGPGSVPVVTPWHGIFVPQQPEATR